MLVNEKFPRQIESIPRFFKIFIDIEYIFSKRSTRQSTEKHDVRKFTKRLEYKEGTLFQ